MSESRNTHSNSEIKREKVRVLLCEVRERERAEVLPVALIYHSECVNFHERDEGTFFIFIFISFFYRFFLIFFGHK